MIHFRGIDVELPEIDQKKIADWVAQTIESEKQKAGQVFFLFCSDAYLLEINRKFLAHDYLTDIITFNNSENKNVISGELYISIERVKQYALETNQDYYEELYRVMIHGILHLLGYDDVTDDLQTEIREKESYYLSNLIITNS
jgi:probable rRNA maturation factor